MKSRILMFTAITLFAALAVPVQLAAQHTRYKLVVIGTLGGPQSYGDAGHGAATLTNRGIAAGAADTNTPDPNYPNFNPFLNTFGPYPFVYHVFLTKNGSLTDLGALPGANDSAASFMTENGLVSGISLTGSIDPFTGWPADHAVLWKDGKIIDLGTLGGYESQAGLVNSRGQVTGFATNAVPDPFSIIYFAFTGGQFSNGTQTRAFLWEESKGMQDIGTLGGPDAFTPYINERGQIAGTSYTNSTPNSTTGVPTLDPFLWENGKMIDLGTLGGTNGGAGGLNNRGQVAGTSNLAGDLTAHAFLWDHGRLQDLGTLGGSFSTANAINATGSIIGSATTAGDQALHAYIWKKGVIKDLGTLPALDNTCLGAFGINAKNQVTGQAVENFCSGPEAHAFLWQNGEMIDLNVFVPPGSDMTLTEVEQINDRGEMFGIGTRTNGELRAFFLMPCGESEEGCIDAAKATIAARQSQLLIAESPATQVRPAPTVTEWRARLARRYHIPGLWTPKN